MYMESICTIMREGKPYTDVAVYLPLEDVRVDDELPLDLQKVSSKYVYELQETKLPRFLKGRHPLWVSIPFLDDAQYADGRLNCGPAQFNWLYVDTVWLDLETVSTLLRLARLGLPICLVRTPQEPGHTKHSDYDQAVTELRMLPNVTKDWNQCVTQPELVAGENLPDFWCTVNGDNHNLFFANPASQAIRYPIRYGQALETTASERLIQLNIGGQPFKLTLEFAPQQSILLQVSPTGVKQISVDFDPNPTGYMKKEQHQ